MIAMPTSPQRSSGTPMMAASATCGDLEQHVLDLGRIHVLAARDVHVLPAVDDIDEAFVVEARGVAGLQPAVGEGRCRRVGLVPVARRDVGPLDQQLADRRPARTSLALVVDDADRRCASSPCRPSPTLRIASAASSIGAGRAGLGHAPALDQRHAARAPSFRGWRAHRARRRRPAILQAREVGALELRMLHHELVGRRHGEEVRDAERWVARCSRAPGRDRKRA